MDNTEPTFGYMGLTQDGEPLQRVHQGGGHLTRQRQEAIDGGFHAGTEFMKG
jgi:hypothetical protein